MSYLFDGWDPPNFQRYRPYGSLYDGRISRHSPGGFHRPFRGLGYDRRDAHFWYYRDYGRCYNRGATYYRPYYYPHVYDGGFYGSVSVYTEPYYYPRAYNTVIYEDVVSEPVITETYYTTPTTVVEPATRVAPAETIVVPESSVSVPDGAMGEPAAPGESADRASEEPLSPSEAPALVEQGNAALAAGDIQDARRLYARAMLADVNDGYAKLFYGLANFASGYFDVAADSFRRAMYDAPELIDDPLDLRRFLSDPQVLESQMTALQAAVAGQPDHHEFVFLLGYMYFSTGRPQQAMTTLQPLATGDSADTLATLVRDAAIRVLPGEESKAPAESTAKDAEGATK